MTLTPESGNTYQCGCNRPVTNSRMIFKVDCDLLILDDWLKNQSIEFLTKTGFLIHKEVENRIKQNDDENSKTLKVQP